MVKPWTAKMVLGLYGEYLREDRKKKVRSRTFEPREYPQNMTPTIDERPIRAFLRVATEPSYRAFELFLIQVYVNQDAHELTIQRVQEFEQTLERSLEKRPFVANPTTVVEATDRQDALIPITSCAKALGIHRSTLHRMINAGLNGVRHRGAYEAVVKKGQHYFVNFLAARDWMDQHHQPGKRRPKAKGPKAA